MKHLLLVVALAPLVFGAPQARSSASADSQEGTWRSDGNNYWSRKDGQRWISLQLERGDSHAGFSVPESEVPALTDRNAAGAVRFTLRRDAGRFEFEGQVADGRGSGRFRFTADPDYLSAMARLGYANLSSDEVWRFAVHDVTREFVEGLQREGVRNLDASDLVKMRIHGVDGAYVAGYRNAGYTLGADELVKTRIHGATPAFAQEVKKEGLGQPSIDDLVKMRIHGVTPAYIKQMRDAGYGSIKIDKLVQFRIHGVDEDLIRSAKAHNFNNLSADDLIELAIHGRRWLKS
jgi:hypothetical protein